jgi:hypothetical protein
MYPIAQVSQRVGFEVENLTQISVTAMHSSVDGFTKNPILQVEQAILSELLSN